jgi:hypothetical protein
MRTPQEMVDAHRDDPSVREIDWELEGTVSIGEQIVALEGPHAESLEVLEALVDIVNDEVDWGLWPIENPDIEGRQRAAVEATILLEEERKRWSTTTIH